MSSLKDRMYNYEVTPPSATWDKIAIDLNESELSNKFPARLYNSELNPPAITWDKIVTGIDESEAGNKLPAKLYNLESSPPATAWEKINAAINPAEQKLKPLSGGLSPFWRYAAAAVVIGAITFFALRLMTNTKDNSTDIVSANVPKDTSKPVKESLTVNEPSTANKSDLDDDDKALEESKKMMAKLDQPIKRIARKLNDYASASQINYISNADKELSQSIYAYEDHVPTIAERYVMLMTPDGNIIRMSKKWSELVCCVAGEDQDKDCKDQIKKWQEKIATSSLAPSPGNFMDILSLVNSLNEGSEL